MYWWSRTTTVNMWAMKSKKYAQRCEIPTVHISQSVYVCVCLQTLTFRVESEIFGHRYFTTLLNFLRVVKRIVGLPQSLVHFCWSFLRSFWHLSSEATQRLAQRLGQRLGQRLAQRFDWIFASKWLIVRQLHQNLNQTHHEIG